MDRKAARLGLMPWERERLTPNQIGELWAARDWRRSRDMEVLAMAVILIRAAFGAEDELPKIAAALPGYDMGLQRAEQRARDAALGRMKGKKKQRRA